MKTQEFSLSCLKMSMNKKRYLRRILSRDSRQGTCMTGQYSAALEAQYVKNTDCSLFRSHTMVHADDEKLEAKSFGANEFQTS
ncbi:hypothetical protein ACEQPO_19370 [Bacillus sp. SL00103]